MASSSVMNVAYWLRLWMMSLISSFFRWPRSMREMRASRKSRKRRRSPKAGMMPRLGIDPRMSIQPRRRMKYSLRGCEPERDRRKSPMKMKQMRLSYTLSVSSSAGARGSSRSTMIASDMMVRTRMKMS